jgi:hypothetical protein
MARHIANMLEAGKELFVQSPHYAEVRRESARCGQHMAKQFDDPAR